MGILQTLGAEDRAAIQQRIKAKLPHNSETFIDILTTTVEVGSQFSGFNDNDVSPRQEANALTALAVRNQTCLESIHTGHRALNEATMKQLMLESSTLIEQWLIMRTSLFNQPGKHQLYCLIVNGYNAMYTDKWEGT